MDVPADVQSLLESLIDLQLPQGTVDVARRTLGDAPDDIENWSELAIHLRENGANDAALLTYDAAMRRFPDNALLWNNRGFVLLAMGQAQGALAHFERAIKLRPGYASALEHRANALERLDRFAFGDPLYNLMMTARDEGRLADAASFACRLLTINPGDPDAQRVVAERRRVSASSWRRQKR